MLDKELEQLGEVKCREMDGKISTFWTTFAQSKSRKSAPAGGRVAEVIATEFIREFLRSEFHLKSGLIFDSKAKEISRQIDAILYRGDPLWEVSEVAVVEKEQVKAIFEIKKYIDTSSIFGQLERVKRVRNPDSGLASEFNRRKDFLPTGAKYILFAFELWGKPSDNEVINRLNQICDLYAVVARIRRGKKHFNFDNSVSRLIQWLRNLT